MIQNYTAGVTIGQSKHLHRLELQLIAELQNSLYKFQNILYFLLHLEGGQTGYKICYIFMDFLKPVAVTSKKRGPYLLAFILDISYLILLLNIHKLL